MDKYARSKECTGQMMFAYPAVGLFFLEALGTGDLNWLQVHQVKLLLKKISFLTVLLHNQ